MAQPPHPQTAQLPLWGTRPAAAEQGASATRRESLVPDPERRSQSRNPTAGPESRRPGPWFRYLQCDASEPGSRTPNPEQGRASSGPAPRAIIAALAFERAFRRLGIRRPLPEFQVEYRAFAGLRAGIRLWPERAVVRMSDLLADAAPAVIEALAEILLARLFRRHASREARELYLAWNMTPATRRRVEEARRARGRKRLLPPRGRNFDLESIFNELNRRFFQGRLAVTRIGWSSARSRTLLGHHDPGHGTITISRWFDSESVPRDVVEYLVYHEMLHIQYPTERNGQRRVVHSLAFREAERKFPLYEKACKHLREMTGSEVR
jgi:hypothetical protein